MIDVLRNINIVITAAADGIVLAGVAGISVAVVTANSAVRLVTALAKDTIIAIFIGPVAQDLGPTPCAALGLQPKW